MRHIVHKGFVPFKYEMIIVSFFNGSQLAKMKKVYSLHAPAMKFIE